MSGDDYVYDEASGEWVPASHVAASSTADEMVVRDAVGNVLADGDQVTLIKDLNVKGAGQTLKRGTLIKSIRLDRRSPRKSTAATKASRAWCCAPEFVRKR